MLFVMSSVGNSVMSEVEAKAVALLKRNAEKNESEYNDIVASLKSVSNTTTSVVEFGEKGSNKVQKLVIGKLRKKLSKVSVYYRELFYKAKLVGIVVGGSIYNATDDLYYKVNDFVEGWFCSTKFVAAAFFGY